METVIIFMPRGKRGWGKVHAASFIRDRDDSHHNLQDYDTTLHASKPNCPWFRQRLALGAIADTLNAAGRLPLATLHLKQFKYDIVW